MRTALAALLLAQASAAAPLCETQVRVEPGVAWVGQQVVFRLQILRDAAGSDVRFAEDLAFPSFRAEWLPAATLDASARDPRFAAGAQGVVVEERRALFPVRAGRLVIPAARIECRSREGSAFAEVAATAIEARVPPASGRPDEDTSLIGRVAIRAGLARGRIALGESVALTVSLSGEANLWDAAPPLAPGAIADLDVHAHEPEIERNADARLVLERSFVYDLVPRRTGLYVVPPLRVAWLDPESGRYEVAESPPLQLEVGPAAGDATPPPAAAKWKEHGAPSARPRGIGTPLVVFGAAIAVAAAALVASRRVRRRGSPARAAAPHLAVAAAAAARGDRDGERSALAAALRAALTVRWPAASTLAPEELVAQSDGPRREAAELLASLDRARFAAGSTSVPSPADRIRTLIPSL